MEEKRYQKIGGILGHSVAFDKEKNITLCLHQGCSFFFQGFDTSRLGGIFGSACTHKHQPLIAEDDEIDEQTIRTSEDLFNLSSLKSPVLLQPQVHREELTIHM